MATELTPRIDKILLAFKRNKKGLTIAELQKRTGWVSETDRASISSIVSRLVREGEVKSMGVDARGYNGRSATVYTLA